MLRSTRVYGFVMLETPAGIWNKSGKLWGHNVFICVVLYTRFCNKKLMIFSVSVSIDIHGSLRSL